jgi:hypothetical protein
MATGLCALLGGLWSGLLILVLQTGWLLPVLSQQAETIIQGGEGPAANYAHLGYIFLEVAKGAGLLVVGWQAAPS